MRARYEEKTEQTSSPLDEIKKLQELRESGAISEEEFQVKKKEFLARA